MIEPILSKGIMKIFGKDHDVLRALRKTGLVERVVFYMIDSKFRRSVNLQSWMKQQLKDSIIAEIAEPIPIIATDDTRKKVSTILRFVKENLTYVGDAKVWDANEYWQTPRETWEKKTGDCEDGAILIYALLNFFGVSNDELRITAGNVQNGGHAYVLWLSDEDGLEYPLDWCFYYGASRTLTVPYKEREEYFFGLKEWFSFNSEAAYRIKNGGE